MVMKTVEEEVKVGDRGDAQGTVQSRSIILSYLRLKRTRELMINNRCWRVIVLVHKIRSTASLLFTLDKTVEHNCTIGRGNMMAAVELN